MTEPDNRPPLKARFGNPNRKPAGNRCVGCQRTKDRDARPGLCGACRDSRDLEARWAREDADDMEDQ